ncbi:MAG: hypothetical protein ACKE9I_07250 [Methylophagaceae bacterium]
MNKLLIALISSFLLVNIAWAHPTEAEPQPQVGEKVARIDTNEIERYNSLPRGVLAKQGVKVKLLFTAESHADYSRYTPAGNNSLFHGALAK